MGELREHPLELLLFDVLRQFPNACAALSECLPIDRELRSAPLFAQTLDKPANWADMLSVGQQQRLGIARLLYHQPNFALMDEATSALDVALEAKVRSLAKLSRLRDLFAPCSV